MGTYKTFLVIVYLSSCLWAETSYTTTWNGYIYAKVVLMRQNFQMLTGVVKVCTMNLLYGQLQILSAIYTIFYVSNDIAEIFIIWVSNLINGLWQRIPTFLHCTKQMLKIDNIFTLLYILGMFKPFDAMKLWHSPDEKMGVHRSF